MIVNIDELDDLDQRFMNLAIHVSKWSPDPRTKVGAVIVDRYNHVKALDCNHFPNGVTESSARLNNKEEKLRFVSHAERNALDTCDTSVRGHTAYITLQPCRECTKSIIQRGITRVVCVIDSDRYDEFVDYSLQMMSEAGLEVLQVQL